MSSLARMERDIQRQIFPVETTLSQQWPPTVSLAVLAEGSPLNFFPFLYRDAFMDLDERHFELFTLACKLKFGSVIVTDQIIDGDMDAETLATGAAANQAMEFEAYRLFTCLFGDDERFWSFLRRQLVELTEVGQVQREVQSGRITIMDVPYARIEQLAMQKCCVSRVVPFGLCLLRGSLKSAGPLVQAIDHYQLGMQIYDDLSDWRDDHESRRISTTMAALCVATGEDPFERDAGYVARRLYYGKIYRRLLERAEWQGRQARALMGSLMTDALDDLFGSLEANSASLRQDMDEMVARGSLRAAPALPVGHA